MPVCHNLPHFTLRSGPRHFSAYKKIGIVLKKLKTLGFSSIYAYAQTIVKSSADFRGTNP